MSTPPKPLTVAELRSELAQMPSDAFVHFYDENVERYVTSVQFMDNGGVREIPPSVMLTGEDTEVVLWRFPS